ncbi:MAG: hypothetical protein HN891_00700 [Planctomycetes bacterium]|jgi:hypothetical protein|nr:hypothetical protein [Planctomycetota bacterium]MBT6967428.1 hypothetical protein [Planctomycetota bacterium]MBT7129217.1 hypothetical protein [Planctomycetota bacterium]
MSLRIYTCVVFVIASIIFLPLSSIVDASDQVFIDTAQIQIIGAHAEDHLGASTSGAGDVNGDGIPDIVAGAPGSDNRSHNTGGKAYVILGSSSPATELDLLYPHPGSVIIIQGAPGGSMLGASVSGAGDINADGYDDYIIGAPGASSSDPDEEEAGRAYIIYGSANPPAIIDVSNLGSSGVEIIGAREGSHLGASVSGARDFDGDGFADILLGAPEDSNDSLEVCGSAFLIRGGNSLPSIIDLKNSHGNVTIFRSGGPNQEVGSCVADLEDFNGDGYSDIAIASMRHSDESSANAGRAWIIYGGSTPPAEVALNDIAASGLTSTTIRVPQANHELGQSISCAGDSDADGDTELLISRSLHDHNPETIANVAYLVRGGFSPPAEINLANPAPWITRYMSFYDNDEDGQSVHTTLDFSGDGIDDHIIGISRSILLDVEKGMAHRVNGGQMLGESQLLDLFQHEGRGYLGLTEGQEVGVSVGAAGDFNDDRGNDLLIGAAGAKPYGRYMAGSVYIFLGHKLRSPNNVQTVCLGQTVDVTWNNRAVYDEVDLFKDGNLLETLPGDTEAYTDSGVAYGDHNYSVRGRRRGINTVKRSSDIRVMIPIAALDCTSLHRDISISWSNSDNYDLIDLYRDGVLQSTLPGGSTSYHDTNVSSGIHQYSVVERGDRTTTLSTSCSITALMPPYTATCSAAPDAQNQIIATIHWNLMPNPNGFELINIYRDGAHIQTLAGDATTTTDVISAGRFIYEIEGVADDGRAVSARATCELVDPISVDNLTCASDVDIATFSWLNTDAYDYIIIEFGPGTDSSTVTEIDQIPGTSQSYTTQIQGGPGDYAVCVRGVKFTGESGRSCCTLTVPDPLGALNCSASGSSVFLSWSNGGTYDSIAIRRDGFLIDTISGSSTSYTDQDVSYGDRTYSITAQRRQGISAAQSCGLTVLRSPAALTCKGEGDQVRLNWQNPAPAYDQVEVMRGSTLLATVSGTTTEYIDSPLAAGDYSYTLRGLKGSSESDSTHCTTVIPEAITALGTGLVEGTHMLLTWAPTEDATSIRIFRDGIVIATLPASATSYIDPTLDPGTYQYCLRARIDNNHSVDTCTPAIVPAPPVEIICGVDSAIATISWTNAEAYDNVILKRDGGTILEDLDGLATSYVDSIAGPGPHLYEVSGRIGDHESKTIACEVTVPYPPADLTCSVSGGVDSVLTWVNTQPSTTIEVWRDGALIAELDPSSAGYTDAGVVPATYSYCVLNRFGPKTSASACCTLLVPAPPTNFSCLCSAGDVDMSWTNNEEYDSVTLLRDGAVIAVLPGATTSYTDLATEPGSHTYTLSGAKDGNSSSTVDCSEDVPAPATDLQITALASTTSLSWSHTGPGDTAELTRNGMPIASLPAATQSHDDTGLAPGDYQYCVTMHIGDATSTTICATIHVLADPSDFSCSTVAGNVEISWTNNDSYSTLTLNRDGQLLAILSGGDSSFQDAMPAHGAHSYDLTAHGGPSSTSATVDCSVDVPSTPTDMACSALGSTASLSWTLPAPGETIELSRNGTVIAMLAGGATSYVDMGAPVGTHEYCIVNMIGSGTSATTCCSARVLAAPTDFSCAAVAGEVDISWTNNDVYDTITLNRDGQLLAILTGSDSSYHDATAGAGAHSYDMTADAGAASISDTVDCTVDVPSTPIDMACSALGSTVSLSWTLPTDGTSVEVSRDGAVIATLGGSATSYEDIGASAGTHEYCVVNQIGSGTSAATCCSARVLAAPTGFGCVAVSGEIDISWTNNDVYDTITLHRDGQPLAILAGSDSSYHDATAGAGAHSYDMTADAGASSISDTVDCTVDVPSTPIDMDCSALGSTVSLSWTLPAPGTTVQISRDGTVIATLGGGASSYDDSGSPVGTHEYCVVNLIGTGTSAATCCSARVISAPTGFGCVATSGDVVLSWTNTDDYDTLSLTRDGALLALLPGTTNSFTDPAQPHGPHNYELTANLGEASTSSTASCSEEVPSTPQNISCSLAGGSTVQLAWDLPAAGDFISLTRNGAPIGSLAGSDTSTTDNPGPGTYEYCLVVNIGNGTGATTCCTIVVPQPLSGIACSTIGDGNALSWSNGEAYDLIQISRDGVLVGFVGGTEESYTDLPLEAGTYSYEVVATLAGSQTAPITCSVTILPAPINLSCTFFGAPIHLNWENTATYSTIHIERNGVLISSIPGSATSTIDVVPAQGTYTYNIWAEHADGITTSTTCSGFVKTFLRGDANSDTHCDIADGIWVLNWLFVNGAEPTCFDSADFDDNGIVTIGDAMLMIFYYLHADGTPLIPPAAPYPDAGLDPTDDVLDCIDSPY